MIYSHLHNLTFAHTLLHSQFNIIIPFTVCVLLYIEAERRRIEIQRICDESPELKELEKGK